MKIFCIGRNYLDHAKEMNSQVPSEPMIFMKPQTAINNSNEIYYPAFTKDLHYELEVLLFISKAGKNITLESASSYYAHIGLGIDLTARDIQTICKEKGHPWEVAKSFDNSAVMGARLPKEDYNVEAINFQLFLNDELVQNGNTKDLIFDFDQLISYISKFFSLEIGDVIFTGTPAGVGPLKTGDKLKAYIESDLHLNLSVIQ